MKRTRLPVPIAPLIEPTEPTDRGAMWIAIAAQRAEQRRARNQRVLLVRGMLAAAAVALLSIGLWRATVGSGARGGALLLASGRPLPSAIQPLDTYQATALDDGSWVTVAAGARLDVLESSPRVFSLALRRGRARFDVRPHGPRTWRVDCGALAIEVIGTAFELSRNEQGARVSVLRGVVLVRGEGVPDRVQRLSAGQTLSVSLPSAARNTPAPVIPNQPDPAAEPLPPRRSSPVAATQPSAWRQAAQRGEWAAAFEQLQRTGVEQELAATRAIDDVLLLADVARLSGHPRAALAPLQRVVREHPGDARAALASFTLGRIRLDALDEADAAARDIERALSLGLPAALAADAQARLVEALARAGKQTAAHDAAEQYRSRFPNGRHRVQIDRLSPPGSAP